MKKNNMTLREAYMNVGKQLLEQSENEFIADVDSYVYMDGERMEGEPILDVVDKKLRVIYNIEIEYRPYGIKEIHAYNFRILPFELQNLNLEEPEVFLFQREMLDASNIQVDRKRNESKYGSFYPTSIDLIVDKEGKVLTDKSTIYF
jgi:hypothetical protein